MLTRRHLLRLGLISLAGARLDAAQRPPDTLVTEEQRGDPDLPYERITFSPSAIKRIVEPRSRASFEPWKDTVPDTMVSVARGFIGTSRAKNPSQIAEFFRLFNLNATDPRGEPYAFCAAGLSFCALVSYAQVLQRAAVPDRLAQLRTISPDLEHFFFYPTVSCERMYHIAAGKDRWTPYSPKTPKRPPAGSIVLFDWDGKGRRDHCGIVQNATADKLTTIEFNTSVTTGNQRNGGVVAEKTRPYNLVAGFITLNGL